MAIILFYVYVTYDANEWIALLLMLSLLISVLSGGFIIASGQGFYYFYEKDRIRASWGACREILYDEIHAICITNGTIAIGCITESGIKLRSIEKDKDGSLHWITKAYVTLHKNCQCKELMEPGRESYSIKMKSKDMNNYLIGFECIFESLTELLKQTDCEVYLLEEIYWRFRDQFEKSIHDSGVEKGKIWIMGTEGVTYPEYIRRIKYEYFPKEKVVEKAIAEKELEKILAHENLMMKMYGKLVQEYENLFLSCGKILTVRQIWRRPEDEEIFTERPRDESILDCMAVFRINTADGDIYTMKEFFIVEVARRWRWSGYRWKRKEYVYFRNRLNAGEEELKKCLSRKVV